MAPLFELGTLLLLLQRRLESSEKVQQQGSREEGDYRTFAREQQ